MTAFSVTIPTRVNIKKRLERIAYKTLTTQDDVNIAYVTSPDVTPETSLSIVDRSTAITENRVLKRARPTFVSGKTFLSYTDKPTITDIFIDTPTQGQVPLFYVHTLANFDPSTETLFSVDFLDIDLKSVSVSEYSIVSNQVYNNLVNSFDGNVATVFYLKYTVKSGSSIFTYHELINNLPVYDVATYLDLDQWNDILPGLKKYYAEQVVGEQYHLVTLPAPGFYAYQEVLTSKIRILEPEAVDNLSPWNIRVSNESFLSSSKVVTAPRTYKYYISEFNNQLFYPGPPYRLHVEDHVSWINPRLLYLDRNIALDNTRGFYLSVYVEDSAGLGKYAFTNNPTLESTAWKDGIFYSDSTGIRSVDQINGFVEVRNNIADTDIVTATFYSAEDTFLFTEIDFNPTDNQEILKQRIVFYIMPESIATGILSQTLFYLVVNRLGEITYCSQAILGADPLPDVNTARMVADDFHTDGTSQRTMYYNLPTYDFTDPHTYSFVDKYTVESVLLSPNGITPSVTSNSYTLLNPHYLLLGEVTIGEASTVDNLAIYDVRTQGGGIKPKQYEAALRMQPEVMWYLDNSPLHPYPGVGAFYVQVPEEILSSNGGLFTRDQIVAIIEKHMKAGGYPLLDIYGIDPVITNVVGYEIYWPSYSDATYGYAILHSQGEDGPWTEETVVIDVPSGNSYTLTGLTTGLNFVRIAALNGATMSYSQTISIRKT